MHSEPLGPNLRRWFVAALATMAVLTACSGSDSGTGTSGNPQTAGSSAEALQPLEQPRTRCGAPDTEATLVRFAAVDGTSLDGILVGNGTAGVVLVHQYPSDLCGFWPYADYLAKRGLQVFAIDLRCFGRSACPDGDARSRVVDDVAAAVAELRRRGLTKVAVGGASMGGTAALIAGTRVQPPVAAVVALSAPANPASVVGFPLDAGSAVRQLAVPTLFVVATNDAGVSVEENRAMYQAVKSKDKRLSLLSGPYDGRHGWQLLSDPSAGRFTSVATDVAAFLTVHTRD